MSLQPPVIPADARISASTLTNQELAYIVDLINHAEAQNLSAPTPGWSNGVEYSLCNGFLNAAQLRGIKNGVVVVTQTVDLRS